MGDSETLPTQPEEDGRKGALAHVPETLALVVVWAEQPHLIGYAYVIPPTTGAQAYVLGRGAPRSEDPHPRLLAVERGDRTTSSTRSLDSPRISRVQLILQSSSDRVLVNNVGQCRLAHNGAHETVAEVRVGDTLRLGRHLLLLCVRRPAWAEPSDCLQPSRFGDADPHGIVGESSPAWRLREQSELVARRSGHVLVLGESGSGKELVARAIHGRSTRRGQPFLARNAAAFPESLIDAEFFGNAKNYPNPGMLERPGLFGLADGATLFLDEIAEMPLAVQSHLLRVMDAGDYQRLGESRVRRSDFRLIGATNRPELLRPEVRARFQLRVEVPNLSVRRDDIPFLVHHLLRKMSECEERLARFFPDGDVEAEPRLSLELVEHLVHRSFATNVRELEQVLWTLIDRSPGDVLHLTPGAATSADSIGQPSREMTDDSVPLGREALLRALEQNNWVVEHTWRTLGLGSRHVLNRLIARYGLRRPVPRARWSD